MAVASVSPPVKWEQGPWGSSRGILAGWAEAGVQAQAQAPALGDTNQRATAASRRRPVDGRQTGWDIIHEPVKPQERLVGIETEDKGHN